MKQSKTKRRVVILVGLMASLLLVLITNPLSVNSTRGQGDPTPTPDRTESVVALEAADVTELRAAIVTANNHPDDPYQIILTDDNYLLTDSVDGENAFPVITGHIEIIGTDTKQRFTRDPEAPAFRFFEIAEDGYLSLEENLVFGSGESLTNGGAIVNRGTLDINRIKFMVNRVRGATSTGGAIYNSGTLTINNSIFSSNHATAQGWHIYNTSTGIVSIRDSCFDNGLVKDDVLNHLGIYNEASAADIDASNNWWGSLDGPSGEATVATGHGESVSDGIVFDSPLSGPPQGCFIHSREGILARVDNFLKNTILYYNGQGATAAAEDIETNFGLIDGDQRVKVRIYFPELGNSPDIAPATLITEITSVFTTGEVGIIIEVENYYVEAWIPISRVEALGLHSDVEFIEAIRVVDIPADDVSIKPSD